MKNTMILLVSCIALCGAAAERLNAQVVNETFPSYVEVSGYAEKEVSPDIFYLKVDIREDDSKGRKSYELQQSSLLEALRAQGVDIEKQVTRLSLSSSYYNRKSNMAAASYQIKFDSADKLSAAWHRLDGMGFSEISFVKAEYSRIEELKNEVRQEAVRNAMQQAKSMGEALGQRIGGCFYLYSGYSGNGVLYAQPRLALKSVAMDAANEESVEESLEFDNIKVSINVNAKFVLKDVYGTVQ